VVIWSITNGKLDDLPVADVRRFETGVREYMRSRHGELLEAIRSDGKLGDDRVETLSSAIDDFKAGFDPSQPTGPAEPEMEALDTLGSRIEEDRKEADDDTPERGPLSDTDAQPPQ